MLAGIMLAALSRSRRYTMDLTIVLCESAVCVAILTLFSFSLSPFQLCNSFDTLNEHNMDNPQAQHPSPRNPRLIHILPHPWYHTKRQHEI